MYLEVEPALVYFKEDQVNIKEFDKNKVAQLLPLFNDMLLKMRKWYLEEELPPQTVDRIACGNCVLQRDCYKKYGSIPSENLELPSPPHFKSIESPESTPNQDSLANAESPSDTFENTEAFVKSIEVGKEANAFIGEDMEQNPVYLSFQSLLRHAAIIGSSGSGKTTLGKVIIEEALKANYSALLIDPQGDLCSLVIPNCPEWDAFIKTISFKIFTPGSEKGIALSLNPLQQPPSSLFTDREYLYMLLDNVSSILLTIMGYSSKKTTPNEKPILEALIYDFWTANHPLNFVALANAIETADTITSLVDGQQVSIESLISSSKKRDLIHNLTKLGTGTDGLFFQGKEQLKVSELVGQNASLYIMNLMGVGTDPNRRQLVISWILRQIYDWILQNPQSSQEQLRFILYFDEIADFLPPHPNDPPSKKMLTLLLRQARKYGVACILATQSPGTIDYKALDNVSTFFIGKIPSEQSYKKILDLVAPYFMKMPPEMMTTTLNKIRTAQSGNFLLINSQLTPQLIQVRSLYSKHQNLTLDQIQQLSSSKK